MSIQLLGSIARGLMVLCLILQIAIPTAMASEGGSGFSLSNEIRGRGRGNEYISGESPGSVLMKINLWGAVGKPGIHYVPVHTDLLTLLSYAGGPLDSALLGDISIKRRGNGKEEFVPVDGESLVHGRGAKNPVLEANDIVVIPAMKPTFSANTVTIVTVIGSLLSIALAGLVLSKTTK